MSAEAQLQELIARIIPVDGTFEADARERLDSLTKPPGSLGRLEDLAARVAIVQHDVRPSATPSAIVLMAGDHGVVAEGVSPYPQDVTWQMVANFSAGGAAINQLAKHAGAKLVLVDVGVVADTSGFADVVQAKVRPGTENMAVGPAMTREEAAEALLTGARVAAELVAAGVRVIGTGEMGIGNTTAAAALAAAFTGTEPGSVVGRGTGLDDAGVAHKAEVIRRALRVNGTDELDALGVLAAVGGLEIAGMAGVMLGAAAAGVCAVSDGFISGAAALAALRLSPDMAGYIFPSHRSVEPGHTVVLEALGLEPVLELDMRLGEGTGAALAIEIIGAACAVMSGMATFAEAGVSGADEA
ncbi:MAG: nicotinate-nucleotide--dimethylbenzimidazole phosphoribosyltransferase [Actinobacteria bacterium HGW-Actinobacteria-6]|nr:MAG: nicotinate-nucleotide--dimethylbenzimidazole phosphoribosyltransferase [Actinobacteria bacterium HGW-Actinobacteria-6]